MSEVFVIGQAMCAECNRPRPSEALPVPTSAVTYCGECHVPLSLDKIRSLFHEANLLDSNAARQFRRAIVDDLIAAVRRLKPGGQIL